MFKGVRVRFYQVRHNIRYSSLISIKLENFHLSLIVTNGLEGGRRKKFQKKIFFPLNLRNQINHNE